MSARCHVLIINKIRVQYVLNLYIFIYRTYRSIQNVLLFHEMQHIGSRCAVSMDTICMILNLITAKYKLISYHKLATVTYTCISLPIYYPPPIINLKLGIFYLKLILFWRLFGFRKSQTVWFWWRHLRWWWCGCQCWCWYSKNRRWCWCGCQRGCFDDNRRSTVMMWMLIWCKSKKVMMCMPLMTVY